MVFPTSSAGRVFLLAGALVLTLSACGKRGALEPPGAQATAPVAAGTTLDPEADRRQAGATLGSPVPGRQGSPRRAFTVPQQPFILDPLL